VKTTSTLSGATAVGLVWSAAWRAEVLHLAFFIAAPACVLLGKLAAVMFFPLLIVMGPGDVSVFVRAGSEQLRNPMCWIALAPCADADVPVPGIPHLYSATEAASDRGAESNQEPFVELPRAVTWRHVWFATWLVWFLVYLIRREGRRTRM
jgi:hypothetical protein